MRSPNAEAVVFDMDGVLVDSTPIHTAAFLAALSDCGIGSFDYDDIAGMRTPEAVRFLLANAGQTVTDATVEALSLAKRQAFRELTKHGPPLMDGVSDAIRELSALGYRLALASSGSASSVEAFLAASAAAHLFEVVLHGDDVVHAKPSPEIYLLAAERLRLPTARLIVVEDSRAGIRAATLAGARVVAFRPSQRTLASLVGDRPVSVEALSDVVKLLATC